MSTENTTDRVAVTTVASSGIGEATAVATELTEHITHPETKAAAEQMYEATAIAPQDIAEIIAFAVSRPRSVSLNEILVRPTAQAL